MPPRKRKSVQNTGPRKRTRKSSIVEDHDVVPLSDSDSARVYHVQDVDMKASAPREGDIIDLFGPKHSDIPMNATASGATRKSARNRNKDTHADNFDTPMIQEDTLHSSVVLPLSKGKHRATTSRVKHSSKTSSLEPGTEDTTGDEALARALAEQWAEGTPPAINHYAPSGSGVPLKTAYRDKGTIVPKVSPTPEMLSKDTPPDERLASFRETFTLTRPCTKCKRDIPSPRGYVTFKDGGSTLPTGLSLILHALCSSCFTNHCRGCFRPVSCRRTCKGPTSKTPCSVERCCAEGRAIALFETLGGFDLHYLQELVSTETRTSKLVKMAAKASASAGHNGTGYGSGHRGTTSSTPSQSKAATSKARNSKADTHSARWDGFLVQSLKGIASLLPAPYGDDPKIYDILPHASIGLLLSVSRLPEALSALVRNDSVTEWIARSDAYYAMLSLLRRMADCELTVQVLIEKRWEVQRSCGLEVWMWGEGEIEWARDSTGEYERSPALYAFFAKLTKQCETFLAGASHLVGGGPDGDESEDGVDATMLKGTSLCGDIIAARDDMQRAISLIRGAVVDDEDKSEPKGKGKSRDDTQKKYIEACEATSFRHATLSADSNTAGSGLSYPDFNFKADLDSTQNATRNPKDRLHLIKELAVMATSLPPGVWVRVDEIRNDVIKVMIAGPEGTPYAGGLFEFDCFIPLQYPNVPPKMHLRTTGGGSVRFNPNLYNSGYVCLSLLGTWPGRPEEQWSPKSTLLQVFVSIQSMILVDAPYFNEPGYGVANPQAPASIQYNRGIAMETVRYAMVDWLADNHREGLWNDVIASHFSIRKKQIREQIVEWVKDNPQMRSYVAGVAQTPSKPLLVSKAQKPIDLLAEFDLGMQRIQKWTSSTGL